MILKDYLSVSGQHGLFKFIAQGRNAMIVENLETGKRTTAFASSKISNLEDISVYTGDGEVALSAVFDKIYEKENGGPAPDEKSDINVLREYFALILPEYDRERVYASDIKKILMWYNTLQKLNLLVKEEPEKEKPEEKSEKKAETTDTGAQDSQAEAEETKPAARQAKKKTAGDSEKPAKSKAEPKTKKSGKTEKK
ncbi:MAG TPA: DUF5606 domain-containing protein [Bacteroidales bacterium]|nr:DUF5606 domain-containing protein [Bacteroidales bacterium]HRT89673.1 DUF5606 domain-containing protein [Bacteroidales bacterium]